MFRSASRPVCSLCRTKGIRASTERYFHRVTTDFISHDMRGNLVARKVPIIIGNPGETYVLIDPAVGSALHAASPVASASATSIEDRCKLTFFHDSKHFGFGKVSPCQCVGVCTAGVNCPFVFNARIIELSPYTRPRPNASPNRFKYKPCNFILEWENA